MMRVDELRTATIGSWRRLPPTTRLQVAAGAALLAVLILMFGVLLPLQEARQRMASVVAREQVRTASMIAFRDEMARLAALPREPNPAGETLRGLVEASARAALAPANVMVTQDGEDNVKVYAAGVPLEQAVAWIDTVRRKQHLRTSYASIRPDAGATCTISVLFSGTAR